jgi:hypothetical protein
MKREAQPTPTFEALIRSREAARMLGVCERILRKLAHEGAFPFV